MNTSPLFFRGVKYRKQGVNHHDVPRTALQQCCSGRGGAKTVRLFDYGHIWIRTLVTLRNILLSTLRIIVHTLYCAPTADCATRTLDAKLTRLSPHVRVWPARLEKGLVKTTRSLVHDVILQCTYSCVLSRSTYAFEVSFC